MVYAETSRSTPPCRTRRTSSCPGRVPAPTRAIRPSVNSGEGYLSFYAGHVSTAFATLSMAAFTIRHRHGEQIWPWVVAGLVAAASRVERVASGHHFPTDVAVARGGRHRHRYHRPLASPAPRAGARRAHRDERARARDRRRLLSCAPPRARRAAARRRPRPARAPCRSCRSRWPALRQRAAAAAGAVGPATPVMTIPAAAAGVLAAGPEDREPAPAARARRRAGVGRRDRRARAHHALLTARAGDAVAAVLAVPATQTWPAGQVLFSQPVSTQTPRRSDVAGRAGLAGRGTCCRTAAGRRRPRRRDPSWQVTPSHGGDAVAEPAALPVRADDAVAAADADAAAGRPVPRRRSCRCSRGPCTDRRWRRRCRPTAQGNSLSSQAWRQTPWLQTSSGGHRPSPSSTMPLQSLSTAVALLGRRHDRLAGRCVVMPPAAHSVTPPAQIPIASGTVHGWPPRLAATGR